MRVMPGQATFLSLSMHIKHKPTESKVHVYARTYSENEVVLSLQNCSMAIPMITTKYFTISRLKNSAETIKMF